MTGIVGPPGCSTTVGVQVKDVVCWGNGGKTSWGFQVLAGEEREDIRGERLLETGEVFILDYEWAGGKRE